MKTILDIEYDNHYCVIPGIKDDDLLDIDFDSWSAKNADFNYTDHIYSFEIMNKLPALVNRKLPLALQDWIDMTLGNATGRTIKEKYNVSDKWVYELYHKTTRILRTELCRQTTYERLKEETVKSKRAITWDSRRPKPELKIKPIGHKQRTEEDVLWEKVLYNVRHRSDRPHRHMRNLIIHLDMIEQRIEESRREQCTASLFDKQELVQQIETLLGRSNGYEILLEDYRKQPYAIY